MKRVIAIVLSVAIAFLTPGYSFAKGGGGKGGGGKGGHYVGGQGSSHKGGQYVNPSTGNHYSNHQGGSSTAIPSSSTGSAGSSAAYSSSNHHQFSRKGSTRQSGLSTSKARPSYMRLYQVAPALHGTVARDSDGRIARSESAKMAYLKQQGYKSVPAGYNVDHIVPLYAGGCDCPSNMQLLSVQAHHAKTKADFDRYAR